VATGAGARPRIGWPLRCGLAVCALIPGMAALSIYGYPIDGMTWLALGTATLWLLVMAIGIRRAGDILFGVPPLVLLFLVFVPWQCYRLQDLRGGRVGAEVWPCFRFGKDGPNTALLESHLGPLEPIWEHQCIGSMMFYLGDWRDGNERVNSRSIIRQDYLPELLARLPNDEARRQVLSCVTEPENLLRVHQGLLLVCLKTLGPPPGYTVDSWWKKHAVLFYIERDAETSTRLVWGWLERTEHFAPGYTSGKQPNYIEKFWDIEDQRRAAEYQQNGGWGGDHLFGEAWSELRDKVIGQRAQVARDSKQWRPFSWPLPRSQGGADVAWWPDYSPGKATQEASK